MIKTTDIWMAAWLSEVKGIKFNSFTKVGIKLTFEYSLSEEEYNALKAEFFHSETAKIKSAHAKFKDLLY
jgi:hypothetical protein